MMQPLETEWRLPPEEWGELDFDSGEESTEKKIMAVVGTVLEDYERAKNDDFVQIVEIIGTVSGN